MSIFNTTSQGVFKFPVDNTWQILNAPLFDCAKNLILFTFWPPATSLIVCIQFWSNPLKIQSHTKARRLFLVFIIFFVLPSPHIKKTSENRWRLINPSSYFITETRVQWEKRKSKEWKKTLSFRFTLAYMNLG